jgi:putative phage tail component, N-terminal domain protein
MSEVTMRFNKTDFRDLIEIHDIQRDIGNNRSISIDQAPRIGVNIQQQTIDAKYIKLDFSIWSKDRNTLKHKLAGIFNVDSPKELTFSDEPDKYYLAMPIESISMQETSGRRSTGSIKFIVPDGLAHSAAYKNFNSDSNAQTTANKMIFTLNNNGTVDAFPIIRVKHNAENGYIGLVNSNTAFELGNREEADTGIVKKSEILLDYRDNKISEAFNRATKNRSITNYANENETGTPELLNLWGKNHVKLREQLTQGQTGHYSTGLSWDIPIDAAGETGSLNDYIFCKQVFIADSVKQYGYLKITVSDTAGQFLYGVETFKRSLGLDCEFNVLRLDTKDGYNFLKRLVFKGVDDKHLNPFSKERGQFEIKRNDNMVQVYYDGSHYNFVIPEIKGKKSAKIHVTLGAFHDKPMVSNMYLDELIFRKDFVPMISDIPNRYAMGSTAVINSEDDTVYIDGIAKSSEVVDGSQWLVIPPGNSQLEIYFSSFIKKKPTVTIEFEERWL